MKDCKNLALASATVGGVEAATTCTVLLIAADRVGLRGTETNERWDPAKDLGLQEEENTQGHVRAIYTIHYRKYSTSYHVNRRDGDLVTLPS